jgi:hypothetical protein
MPADPLFWLYAAAIVLGSVSGLAALPWSAASIERTARAADHLRALVADPEPILAEAEPDLLPA